VAVLLAPWPAATTTRLLAGFGAAAAFAAVALVGSLEVMASGRLLAVFAAAMTAIVLFPTCHCQVQVTASGVVHGAASVVAFTSLPLAVLRLAARQVVAWQRLSRWATRIARACLCCLAPTGLAVLPIVLAVPVAFPFGLVQRATGLFAVALLLLLAGWAWQAS
jgi:hypothetical protein